jgi:hypothetical protein
LNDTGVLPRLSQQAKEAGIIRRVEGLAHAPSGGEAPGKLILNQNYPIMGFSALLPLDFTLTGSNPVMGYCDPG